MGTMYGELRWLPRAWDDIKLGNAGDWEISDAAVKLTGIQLLKIEIAETLTHNTLPRAEAWSRPSIVVEFGPGRSIEVVDTSAVVSAKEHQADLGDL